jgi:hypothetical protein
MVMVLGGALLLTVIGMSALTLARVESRNIAGQNEAREASLLALSGIEYGLNNLDFYDNNWRTFTHGEVIHTQNLGNGTMSWMMVDPDGNLNDDDTDSFRLYGIGQVGTTTRVYSVLMDNDGTGLTCLEAAVFSNRDLSPWNGTEVTSNGVVSTNGSVDATRMGVVFNANVEAVGTITGNITGTTATGVAQRVLPDATVFDYYRTNGTWIKYDALSSGAMANIVLSPSNNPFGSPNRQGIYVIDCEGQNVSISRCRIVGTVLLHNAGSGSVILNAVNWAPSVPNYPALMVQGGVQLRISGGTLDESGATNFNPTGTPYEGSADSDTVDTYPSIIQGLVYASGRVLTDVGGGDSHIEGAVVANFVSLNDDLHVTYNPIFLNIPPPGFAGAGTMRPVAGSFRRDTMPN